MLRHCEDSLLFPENTTGSKHDRLKPSPAGKNTRYNLSVAVSLLQIRTNPIINVHVSEQRHSNAHMQELEMIPVTWILEGRNLVKCKPVKTSELLVLKVTSSTEEIRSI